MIPIYEAQILDELEGISKISLVDLPAVEADFQFFNKQEQIQLKIENEDKKIVFGPIMRANFLIYRYSPKMGEYYIVYKPEVIKQMAEKMLSDGTFNNINLQHTDGTDTDDVKLLEVFIKDTEAGINPVGFESIEDGSLFGKYQIYNDDLWAEIKAGTFKGFSLEGLFELEEQKYNKSINMNKIIEKYLATLIQFGSAQTDKGEIQWIGDKPLEVGLDVFKEVDGEKVALEDGVYTDEDGNKITVADGVVTNIETAEPETDTEVEAEVESEETLEEVTEETESEEPQEEPTEETTEDETDDLKAQIESLEARLDSLEQLVAELLAQPVADPVVDEYTKVESKTVNKLGQKLRVGLIK